MTLKKSIKSFFIIAILAIFPLVSFAQANPENPYDNVGKQHNEMLEKIVDGMDKGKLPNSKFIPDLLDGIIPVCFPLFEGFLNFDDYSMFFKKMNENNINISQIDPQEYYSNLLEENTISNTLYTYLLKLDNILKGEESAEKVVLQVKLLESEVSKELNEEELAIFYSASSVARYSMFYWSTGNGNSLQSQIYAKNTPGGDIARSDTKGVIGGATMAAGMTWWAGTFTLGAVGTGAVAGGVGASLGEAVVQAYDWYWGNN